jgi:histidinol-phosphate aminotransferase
MATQAKDKKMASPKPLAGLTNIAPYVGGESEITGFDRVIKLASNEGAFGPSPKTQEALKKIAGEFHRYPDGDSNEIRDLLADKNNLPKENIICGAGSDELISLLCRSYAGPGDEILYSAHGFAMYPIYGRTVGATVIGAPENGITIDVDQMLSHVTENTKLIFIANPNNPTGTYLPKSEVQRLIDGLPEDILLVIDSAYAEFVDRDDYSDGAGFVASHDNVVMLRTFSKIYGMGGLRLGWGYAPDDVIDILNRMRSPFNVAYPAMVAGVAAIQDQEFVKMSQEHNKKWLAWTTEQFRALGLEVPDSVCNFVLVHFPEDAGKNATAESADEFLKSKGIIVRRMAGYGLPDALRISIGLEDEMKIVVDALTEFVGT